MGEGTEQGTPSVGDPKPALSRDAADALAAIVQSSDDAIYSKDRKAVITSWNPGAERLYGWTAQEAIGRPIAMLIPDSHQGEEIEILERILRGERVDHYETERQRKDGQIVAVSVSVSPVRDERGEIVEAAAIARDITAQRELDTMLAARSRKRALELNDEVVQGLATAKLALESGRHEHGLTAIRSTLERARDIVSSLLDEADRTVEPGDLVRGRAASFDQESGAQTTGSADPGMDT